VSRVGSALSVIGSPVPPRRADRKSVKTVCGAVPGAVVDRETGLAPRRLADPSGGKRPEPSQMDADDLPTDGIAADLDCHDSCLSVVLAVATTT
jgi:hypothetical protein